jgi:DNA-binding NarL/FixJ family response regulator
LTRACAGAPGGARAPAAPGGAGAGLGLHAAPRAAATGDDHGGLTSREVEVLRLLADGLTNREIGERLFISQKTVGAHMAHIYAKLGVHSRVEAAGRARQLGV